MYCIEKYINQHSPSSILDETIKIQKAPKSFITVVKNKEGGFQGGKMIRHHDTLWYVEIFQSYHGQ